VPRGGYSGQPRGVYTNQSRGVYQTRGVYTNQSRGVYQTRGVYTNQARAVYRAPYRGYSNYGHYGYRGVYAAPYRYYRPYYSFRPRFSIGFGLWIGYPVAYTSLYYGYPYPSYGYPAPYPYPYPYAPTYYPPPAYGYPMAGSSPAYPPASYSTNSAPQTGYYEADPQQGSVVVQPGAASGSVSFEITPSTAEVYIDGKYVGRVSDFGPTSQPIALTPGRRHVEIRAAGYQTLTIDADVVAGQVIPYRGTMQVAR